jgi:hypothetical protein
VLRHRRERLTVAPQQKDLTMTRITGTAVAAVAALALAGCGSAKPAASPHPADLAHRIPGFYTYTAIEATMFAREEGNCTLVRDGSSVDIASFASQDNQHNWLRVAQGFGGIYVVGQLWIASVDTQADAQAVQSAIGGTIH